MVGVSIVSVVDSPVTLLTLICIVAFLFQLTLGPLAPLYAAEVCTDVALGAVMITEDVVVLLQDFVTPVLLNSPMQPVGVFLMFGVFSCIGLLFIYFYVPETKGLSEQEKREIFMPGAKAGRQLNDDEDCMAGYEHRSDATIQNEVFQAASFVLSNQLGSSAFSGGAPNFAMRAMSSEQLKLNEMGPMVKITEMPEPDSASATSESVSDDDHELDRDKPLIQAAANKLHKSHTIVD